LGFVEMSNDQEARTAIERLNGTILGIAPLLSTRHASANRQEAEGTREEIDVQTIAIGANATNF